MRVRIHRAKFFPVGWLEVAVLLFDRSIAKNPRRRSGQHVNVLEKSAVTENATTGNKLSHTLRIRLAEFRSHGQNRFGLRGKIECVVGFVITETMHPVTVVEQRCNTSTSVRNEAMKQTVQPREKIAVLLIHVYKIRSSARIERMAARLEATSGAGLRILLSRKHQRHVSTLVRDGHAVAE